MQKKLLRDFAGLCFCIIFLFAGCATVSQKSPEEIDKPEVLAEFSISGSPGLILLPVDFDGEEYQFVLDTGSSRAIFDVSLKDKLGKQISQIQGKDANGKPFTIEVFKAPHAHLDKLCLARHWWVGVIDLEPVSSLTWQKIDGIIGMDFLKKYAVQIDFDNRKVLFLKSKREGNIFSFLGPAINKHPEWGQPVSIRYKFRSNQPFVKGIIGNNISADFLIDTGFTGRFFGGFLESKIFKRTFPKNIFKERTEKDVTIKGMANLDFNDIALADKFSLGPFEYEDIGFGEHYRSLLGLEFLSRHLVTFDFPNKKMYLQKNDDLETINSEPLHVNGFEFVLNRKNNNIYVQSVDPNGLAFVKGIRQNDIFIKLNEQDISSCSLNEFSHLLLSLPPNINSLSITIKRNDTIKEIRFP